MGRLGWEVVAAAAFVGSHLLLSHPLRRLLVGRVGEGGFAGIYSLVAAVTLVWLGWTFWSAPPGTPLWVAGDLLWALVTAVMLVAAALLVGSLVRNPALPTGGAPGQIPEAARGVYAVTRHPMMWAVALWAGCHILAYPVAKSVVLSVAMAVLALGGAALQDRKKEALQPDTWRVWESRTSYWPFAAILAGRARFGGLGAHVLGGGALVWLVATWAHIPLSGWAAGIWRWIRLPGA